MTRRAPSPAANGGDDADRAYNRAVRLLAARARSTEEVRRRLRAAGYGEEAREAALARLTDEGYLDDAAFATAWVEWRTGSKPRSRSAIRRELMGLGVPAEVVAQAVSAVDDDAEFENAARLALDRLRRLEGIGMGKQRQRLSTYLRARGYGWDLVRKVLSHILGDRD
jgi:regulatory protein